MMDIDNQTAPLCKKIEKLQWQIDNAVLSDEQIREKKEQIATLKTQIENFGNQLTPLRLSQVHTSKVGIMGGKGKAFPGLCTGKAIQ